MREGAGAAGGALLVAIVLVLALLPTPTLARDAPGKFDYWILSLSWSPQFCARNLADEQCRRAYDFVVHGLWPQHEEGYPEYCGSSRSLDRDIVQRMLPLMPSEKLVIHQWRKHGSCSGMEATEYFLNVERARRAIAIPKAYAEPKSSIKTSAREVEQQFLRVNPGLSGDQIALQCSGRWLKEVRFCLDRKFQFRACGLDVKDECGKEIVIRPNRGR